MAIEVPAGARRVELSYARTGLDWITIAIALGSALVALWLIVRPPTRLRSQGLGMEKPDTHVPG